MILEFLSAYIEFLFKCGIFFIVTCAPHGQKPPSKTAVEEKQMVLLGGTYLMHIAFL
jgi:hypothetical protein